MRHDAKDTQVYGQAAALSESELAEKLFEMEDRASLWMGRAAMAGIAFQRETEAFEAERTRQRFEVRELRISLARCKSEATLRQAAQSLALHSAKEASARLRTALNQANVALATAAAQRYSSTQLISTPSAISPELLLETSAQVAQLVAEIGALKASTSWRITAPFRAVILRLRRSQFRRTQNPNRTAK